jgi:hypothetical protein
MINPTKIQKAEGRGESIGNDHLCRQVLTSSKQLHCGLGGKNKKRVNGKMGSK